MYLFIYMLWDPHRAFDMFVGIVKIKKTAENMFVHIL